MTDHKSQPVVGRSWRDNVRRAVVEDSDGFMSRTNHRNTGDSSVIRDQPTRNAAVLRAWIYRDVHVRVAGEAVSFLSYDALPVTDALRAKTVRSPGWRSEPGKLIHARRSLTLATLDTHMDGFSINRDCVELPRLRCGTAAGWLTVAGVNGEVSRHCQRIYLPGIGLSRIEELVDVLDTVPGYIPWSLKSSIGVDRSGNEIHRSDRTVIYVDDTNQAVRKDISIFLDALSSCALPADGPGFSVPLRVGVYFGGSGNDHGSFGTKMAGIAATALLRGSLLSIDQAEQSLRRRADQFQNAGD